MKNPKLTIIGLMMCSFFSGCKSEKEQVRDNIEQMKSRPIELCLDKMECRPLLSRLEIIGPEKARI